MSDHLLSLPPDLPAPEDDGACDHLPGATVPALALPSSLGPLDLAELAADRAVLYVYPRTGKPDRAIPAGWDAVPGARGCTPQSCSFRDRAADFERLQARVAGLSAQPLDDQLEVAERLQLSYPVVADPALELARMLGLPTFTFDGVELYRRVTLVLERGRIAHVFYPVFPPDENAAGVVAWLEARS